MAEKKTDTKQKGRETWARIERVRSRAAVVCPVCKEEPGPLYRIVQKIHPEGTPAPVRGIEPRGRKCLEARGKEEDVDVRLLGEDGDS